MKNISKYIVIGMLAAAIASCASSFLEEKMVSTITQEYFDTEQGLNELIVGTYNVSRVDWGYWEGLTMYETGHDAGRFSGQNNRNMYSTSDWSAGGYIGGQVNNFMGYQSKPDAGFLINLYPIIDNCNKAIGNIRSGKARGRYATDAAFADAKLSEALFNRALAYYKLNTILGDVYFSTTSATTLPENYLFPRTPAAVMYKELIRDLRFAVEKLSPAYGDAEFGRATKYAAAHLLAKIYLNRYQSKDYGTAEYGRKADGTIDNLNEKSYLGMLYKGTGTADLDSAIYYSTLVINAHPLAPNYHDVFRHDFGKFDNEGISENVFSAVYSESGDNYRYGTRALKFYIGNYVNSAWGIPDYCWEYPSQNNGFHCHTNDFGLDVFTDKINDARYQYSFWLEFTPALRPSGNKDAEPAANTPYYAYNSADNKSFVWTQAQADYFNANIKPAYIRPSWAGRSAVKEEHKIGNGDLSFAILENTKATAISREEAEAQPFVLFARWMKDGSKYYYRPVLNNTFPTYTYNAGTFNGLERTSDDGVPFSKKYDDPNRNGIRSDYYGRDVPVFRSSEMYLVRAEAYGRKGNYASAINDINALRQRASFKVGETRDEVLARLYPGHENLTAAEQQYPYKSANDTYNAITVDVSYWNGSSAKSQAEMYCPSANTDDKRFIEFICNEYAREFNSEMIYYGVIHHAGVQAARIQWHDQMGANPANTTYAVGVWDASDNVVGTTGQTGQPKGGFQNYMTFKPFPDAFINMLTDDKANLLDAASKKAYQNYGY